MCKPMTLAICVYVIRSARPARCSGTASMEAPVMTTSMASQVGYSTSFSVCTTNGYPALYVPTQKAF
jgi:hypothetical protein